MKTKILLLNFIIIFFLINVNLAIKKDSPFKEIQKNNNNKKENHDAINYYEDEDGFDVTIKDCISILVPYGKCTKIKSPFKKCPYKSIFISSNSTTPIIPNNNYNNNNNNKNKNNGSNQYIINLFENSKCYEKVNRNKNKIFKNFHEEKNYKESKKNELIINCKDKKLNKFNNNEIRVVCPISSKFDSSTSSISINTLAILSLLFLIFINKLIN
ncbi:hypothetical protein DDB_G0267860 [Dictyostelium discoideum AX4]|uniref:Putative transmembrane protein DDB_G0267860 n=1 Tax=Dictyostelium discoideum TaxID=44689 RepID=Y9596_DICDI|nr:hypothetical protein DDB_G0267860 [Dictyostelium discoideum AX4]Q55G23.1 RecName: Full=Putative transmembrane protein DDB_G0267860; Flags: Precursor [Dictyostelium discoideum]EAL73383.1 hypothetical protein DDB_G0267860 [Dictyostelium discoideum AX4]|eukprot:XP_647360.1 hypothetical protein DDB_G0267860 [Dictyostelium discoideum AX4]